MAGRDAAMRAMTFTKVNIKSVIADSGEGSKLEEGIEFRLTFTNRHARFGGTAIMRVSSSTVPARVGTFCIGSGRRETLTKPFFTSSRSWTNP